MNWDQFRKNLGSRVQVEPIACRLDQAGKELPEESDDWLIQAISQAGVISLKNLKSGHVVELGKDHIFDFRSNPGRSKAGQTYGLLVLKVQVFMQGQDRWWLRPNGRPGERVSPRHVPKTGAEPSGAMLQLMTDLLASDGWAGTRVEFNAHAARVLYGKEFGSLLGDPADYFSALIVSGYVWITSLTDLGNRPDGTPDTMVTLELTALGKAAVANRQSNSRLERSG